MKKGATAGTRKLVPSSKQSIMMTSSPCSTGSTTTRSICPSPTRLRLSVKTRTNSLYSATAIGGFREVRRFAVPAQVRPNHQTQSLPRRARAFE